MFFFLRPALWQCYTLLFSVFRFCICTIVLSFFIINKALLPKKKKKKNFHIIYENEGTKKETAECEKMTKQIHWLSFILFIFYHSAISFFPFLHFHILYEVESIYLLVPFLLFSYFVFHSFIFIYNMKSSQSICLFVFSHSAIAFSFPSFSYIISWGESMYLLTRFLAFSYFFFFPSFSYIIWNEVNLFAYSFSRI